MLLWFEEFAIDAAMILAIATAAIVFVWATASLLIGWLRYAREARLAHDETSKRSVPPVDHTHLGRPA